MTESDDLAYHRELEPQSPKKPWGCIQWMVVTMIIGVGCLFFVPAINSTAEKAPIMMACTNCRQIIISLKNYAGDNNGAYPYEATSNNAFRVLFMRGIVDDERAFTSPFSPFVGDNNIGSAPDFTEALKAGENHWAMTRGLSDSSSHGTPLIFENPITASWPPMWDVNAANQPIPGRSWVNGRIIVGLNDGSVSAETLTSRTGSQVTLKPVKDDKNLFELAGLHEVMDIAR